MSSMIKVYAYSGCSTCKSALKFLKDRKEILGEFVVVFHPGKP